MTLSDAIKAANDADNHFETAVKAAGFKSRWEVKNIYMQQSLALQNAYYAKITADRIMGEKFRELRDK